MAVLLLASYQMATDFYLEDVKTLYLCLQDETVRNIRSQVLIYFYEYTEHN